MVKECKAEQAVCDWDKEEEEENSAPKSMVLISPPHQPKMSNKQGYCNLKLNSPPPDHPKNRETRPSVYGIAGTY